MISTTKKAPSRGKAAGKPRKVARDEDPTFMAPLTDQLQTGMTLRFVTTASFNGVMNVTYQNLLDAWFVAGTATTAFQLFDFVKIKHVTVRALPQNASSGNLTSVSVEFPGLSTGQAGGGNQRTNSSLGYSSPAFIKVKPGSRSQAGQFQPSSVGTAFWVRATDVNGGALLGAVIDVGLVFRNSSDVNPAGVATARAGLVPGNVYFGGLDGATNAATAARTVFVPAA